MVQAYELAQFIEAQLNELDTNDDGVSNIKEAFENSSFRIRADKTDYDSGKYVVETDNVSYENFINGILYDSNPKDFLPTKDFKSVDIDYKLVISVPTNMLTNTKNILNEWLESVQGQVFMISGWSTVILGSPSVVSNAKINEIGESVNITIDFTCVYTKYGLVSEDTRWTIQKGSTSSVVYPASVEYSIDNNAQAFPLLKPTSSTNNNDVKYLTSYKSRTITMVLPVSENVIVKELYRDIYKPFSEDSYTIKTYDSILGEEYTLRCEMISGFVNYELGQIVSITCVFAPLFSMS